MRRAIILVVTTAVVLVAGAAVAAAGGGGGGYGQCDAFGFGSELRLLDSCFDATAQFVEAGSELRVTNEGGVGHTITAADGSFDSGSLAPGETFELTLDEPGVIRVYCRPHGGADGFGMAGVLIVGEPAPQADGAEQVVATLRRALDAQGREFHDAVGQQTRQVGALRSSVSSLSRDVRELRAAIEADPEAEVDVRVLGAGETAASGNVVPGLIGLVVGGGLAAVALRRRRPSRAADDPTDDGATS